MMFEVMHKDVEEVTIRSFDDVQTLYDFVFVSNKNTMLFYPEREFDGEETSFYGELDFVAYLGGKKANISIGVRVKSDLSDGEVMDGYIKLGNAMATDNRIRDKWFWIMKSIITFGGCGLQIWR